MQQYDTTHAIILRIGDRYAAYGAFGAPHSFGASLGTNTLSIPKMVMFQKKRASDASNIARHKSITRKSNFHYQYGHIFAVIQTHFFRLRMLQTQVCAMNA